MQFKFVVLLLSLLVLTTAVPLEPRDKHSTGKDVSPNPPKHTPIAQKSFHIPSSQGGKFNHGNPKYKAKGGCKKHHFKVKHHHPNGGIHDPHSPWHVHRDLPCICPIGHRMFWFFDDTFAYKADGAFVGAASNSLAVANDVDNPSNITDISVAHNGDVTVAIPWTDSEAEIQYDIEARYAFWAYGPCVPIGPHHSWHFWAIVKFYGFQKYRHIGHTLAQYEYDEEKDQLSISRHSTVYYGENSYPYGAFASISVSGTIYLYAIDPNSDQYDIHVAAAPQETVDDKDTWKYWDGSSKSWSKHAPNGSVRNKKAACIVGKLPFSTGNIFWSDYHNAYLLVFFSYFADSTFWAITAPTPVGPWDFTPIEIVKTKPGSNGYNYGGQATPAYYSGGNGQLGQKLVLSYTYQDNDTNWYPASDTVIFE
ncbi:hypothetical protein V1517DRAFT_89192 [Lipomyces orientalis]|uniref:Uncharacterized protein n=1 Tax=Lipomyces orientalis TaxID=1233043 RepID=A0ACC3TRS8_9ASCO